MPQESNKPVAKAAKTIGMNCLAARTRLINRTITAIYDEALRPLGVTSNQLTILVVVTNGGPISPSEIAQNLNMEKSTVSRNIGRMRSNGWLTVTPAESGRGQWLTLNDRGSALVAESLPLWKNAQAQAKAVLGQRGADSIRSLGNLMWD